MSKTSEKGFLLQRVSFSESSLVVNCFTLDHGLKSYLVQGAKKKYASVLYPLAPLEFTAYQRHEDQLAKMIEPALMIQLPGIQFNPLKSGIVFFEVEILKQCLHEGQIDKELFYFLSEEISWLNASDQIANYPIFWLLELSSVLGFKPHLIHPEASCFDLINGELKFENDGSPALVQHESVLILKRFLDLKKEDQLALELEKEERKELLELLLEYFRHHISNFSKIKTIEVYQMLWYD